MVEFIRKVTFVTGTSSGIGHMSTLFFAREYERGAQSEI